MIELFDNWHGRCAVLDGDPGDGNVFLALYPIMIISKNYGNITVVESDGGHEEVAKHFFRYKNSELEYLYSSTDDRLDDDEIKEVLSKPIRFYVSTKEEMLQGDYYFVV